MICNVPLMHSQFWAAVCFRTAGFKVYTLHALQAIKGLKGLLKTSKKKEEVLTPTPHQKIPLKAFCWNLLVPPSLCSCLLAHLAAPTDRGNSGGGGGVGTLAPSITCIVIIHIRSHLRRAEQQIETWSLMLSLLLNHTGKSIFPWCVSSFKNHKHYLAFKCKLQGL